MLDTILILAALLAVPADDAALMRSDDQAVQRGFTQQRRTVPAPFHGQFRSAFEECAPAVPPALAIRATRLTLPDSDADVLSVRVEGPRKVVVSSLYESSSDIWEKSETLLLSRDGKRLAVVTPAGSRTLLRCPMQPAQ